MTDLPAESLEARLRVAEARLKRVNYLLAGLVLFVLLVFAVLWRNQQRVVATDSLFTSQLTIPRRFAASASAGIAPSTDGASVSLWLSSSLFPPSRDIRMEVGKTGEQSLRFYDTRGKVRLSLGLSADGSPQLSAQDANGNLVWSAVQGTASK